MVQTSSDLKTLNVETKLLISSTLPRRTTVHSLPLKWTFADSHTRIVERVRPPSASSSEFAGVNMRLQEGAIRELHWHREAEWAYMFEGSYRFTRAGWGRRCLRGRSDEGRFWYAPKGRPHSIQGVGKGECELILIFGDANFSEDVDLPAFGLIGSYTKGGGGDWS